jgi:hypothetical protein
VLEPNEILPEGGLEGADLTKSGQEGMLGREVDFHPMMTEEGSEQEEPGEWISQMEILEFPEVSVPIRKPKSSIPKRVWFMTPLKLVVRVRNQMLQATARKRIRRGGTMHVPVQW